MADILEGTPEFNRGHSLITGQVPITVSDDERLDMFTEFTRLAHQDPMHDDDPAPARNGAAMDPFADDKPLACGLENPEGCEACD